PGGPAGRLGAAWGGGSRVPPSPLPQRATGGGLLRRTGLPPETGLQSYEPGTVVNGPEEACGGGGRAPSRPRALSATGRRIPRRGRLPPQTGIRPQQLGDRAGGLGQIGGSGGGVPP